MPREVSASFTVGTSFHGVVWHQVRLAGLFGDSQENRSAGLLLRTCCDLVYIMSQLQHVNRLDVVWDQYFPESLKAETRSKRGKGVCRRVEPQNTIPGNLQEFLRINDRSSFLATCVHVAGLDTYLQANNQHPSR